jgi:hypothetical protein
MKKADDEFGKRILAPLQPTPPLDPNIAAEEKNKYLLQVESIRQGIIPGSDTQEIRQAEAVFSSHRRKQRYTLLRSLAAVLVALIILVGSSLTVYAAQDSLPGESLYTLKAISEDIRLSVTHSPQARLDITLDYTNRRVDEISHLLAVGKSLSAQASERYQGELEGALLLASQMEDTRMLNALEKIKSHAENQGMTIEKLINQLPEQADPAIVRLQARLSEQVKLSMIGEDDPQTFRLAIHERQNLNSHKHKSTPASNDSISTPSSDSTPPSPTNEGGKQNNGNRHSTQSPDDEESSPDEGNPNSGNGNHNPDPSRTQKP